MTLSEVFITGANGEVGHSLIKALSEEGIHDIVALDLHEPEPALVEKCSAFYRGDILDRKLLDHITDTHRFDLIFHLAGLLSSRGEKDPSLAHRVNVEGSRNIFRIANTHSNQLRKRVKFMFSSSIAAFGIREGDDQSHPVTERQYLTPATMYGINKLYVEQLGRYYTHFFKRREEGVVRLDFRCVRFPGLISPNTLPSGGTSDYGPEMLHAAARGVPYDCFVRADTRMPFMVMSDAIRSLLQLARADGQQLKHRTYNVTSFSVSAEEIRREILKYFPDARIGFKPNPMRQSIVDSWPMDMDDSAARRDWGWQPIYDFETAFADLLVPMVKARYTRT